ncbi:MAG: nucleotidyltransferase domain-containing protein [Clostridiales bacterium]|nr:nucleotidyltransferase domain-containing protein [Clostridiales bacterium]MCD7828147.1 nucleotidyltransferase domain-containing protein [Clostridiales bacterium]
MKFNIPNTVLSEIRLFAKIHNIERVILFGSRARGDYTDRSDIDIAVYGGDFNGFFWDIKEKTHSLLMFDVVDMNRKISDELQNIISKEGIAIYEKA